MGNYREFIKDKKRIVIKIGSPFTKENGYALAGSYENGQTVQTYGGA